MVRLILQGKGTNNIQHLQEKIKKTQCANSTHNTTGTYIIKQKK